MTETERHSKFTGVYVHKSKTKKMWFAGCMDRNGETVVLGVHFNPLEAAKQFDSFAKDNGLEMNFKENSSSKKTVQYNEVGGVSDEDEMEDEQVQEDSGVLEVGKKKHRESPSGRSQPSKKSKSSKSKVNNLFVNLERSP